MKPTNILILSLFLAVIEAMAQTPSEDEWKRQVELIAPLIKSNPEAASDAFDDLLKGKNKKNIDLLLKIGRAYLEAGKADGALHYANRVKEVDGKCAEAYLLSGDAALAQKNVNQASSDFNQAIYLDEDCNDAYLKYAEVYQGVNPQLSIEMLERLQAKEAKDSRINKRLGDIYYGMGEYGKAITAYDTYMTAGSPSVADYARYATLLYLNKEYEQSLDNVRKGLSLDADNLVLKRLAMYDDYELGNHEAGIKDAIVLFADPDHPDLVYLDYLYWGNLLSALKQYPEAIVQYEKALSLDGKQADIHREMAEAYEKIPDYPKAIAAFRRYMDALKTPSDIGDLFLYGRLNYFAASDSAREEPHPQYLEAADSAFAQVIEYAPDNYLGNFWRARTNSLLDPETTEGLAKPYYEAALVLLEQKPDASKDLVKECLSYLGYYYFLKQDYPQSKEYWNRILEIDPENETAKLALEGIK